MIEVPNSLTIVADEHFGRLPVVGATDRIGRARLSYQDTKTPTPYSAPLIVQFVEGNQTVAEAFAIRLRAAGYSDVVTELVESPYMVGANDA